MATITLEGIGHAYGPAKTDADYALKPLHHVWEQGRAYALLGPSGCGKTTLLNIISGLITPSHGRLLFDGVDVTRLPTERRNIAHLLVEAGRDPLFPAARALERAREQVARTRAAWKRRGLDGVTSRSGRSAPAAPASPPPRGP